MRLVRCLTTMPLVVLIAACDSGRTPTAVHIQAELRGNAGPTYDVAVTELGTLGGALSEAYDINDADQIIGESETATGDWHAFLWSQGTMVDLGTLGGVGKVSAEDLNDAGWVVGWAPTPTVERHAYVWRHGQMTDLGTLGGKQSMAVLINNAGQIVGYSELTSGTQHTFLWEQGVMKDLGALLDVFQMNDAGQLTGEFVADNGEQHAFLWAHGVLTDLGTLGGNWSEGTAINRAGVVVGASLNADNEYRAFVWENGVMTDLGTLGGTNSGAWGINDAGQILGESVNADGKTRCFIWEHGVMTELSLPDNFLNARAVAINNSGEVLCQAFSLPSYALHPLLWVRGVMTDLGTFGGREHESRPQALNARGHVVGDSEGHALMWELKPVAVAGH